MGNFLILINKVAIAFLMFYLDINSQFSRFALSKLNSEKKSTVAERAQRAATSENTCK